MLISSAVGSRTLSIYHRDIHKASWVCSKISCSFTCSYVSLMAFMHTTICIFRLRDIDQYTHSIFILPYADPGGNRSLPSMPPSTMMFTPVTCPLSTGDASTATCLATSSGRATFCKGVVDIARSTKAVSFNVSVAMGVATQPGLTEFTRPFGAIRTISFLSCSSIAYQRQFLQISFHTSSHLPWVSSHT